MSPRERGAKPEEDPRRPVREPRPISDNFNIRVDNSALLFEAAQKGISGEIGRLLLEKPLREIEVKLESNLEDFNLATDVRFDFGLLFDNRRNFSVDRDRMTSNLLKRYPRNQERGGNLIITTLRGTNILIGRSSIGMEDVAITTGIVDQIGRPIQVVPGPKLTPEIFEITVSDYTEFLERYINEVYKLEKKATSEQELVLRTPKQLLRERGGRRLGGLADISTPEGLIGKIEIEQPHVSFDEIGGQEAAKREIEGLAFALKNPDLYKKWGTKPPKGIILYGQPGTGKTLMARALASQANARFFHVEASDISSKWYGESEEIVRQIFDLADSSDEKTIIFFDEIDAVAPHRTGAHEATQRVLATLLENMDGIVAKENVVVVASTNRLGDIEPALLRAGRFDRWVEVTLPDETGRRQIFEIHMKKAEVVADRKLFNDVNFDEVVTKTDKSSGADIAEIIRRSLEEKVRMEGTTGKNPHVITTADLLKELDNYERTKTVKRSIGFQTSSSMSQGSNLATR